MPVIAAGSETWFGKDCQSMLLANLEFIVFDHGVRDATETCSFFDHGVRDATETCSYWDEASAFWGPGHASVVFGRLHGGLELTLQLMVLFPSCVHASPKHVALTILNGMLLLPSLQSCPPLYISTLPLPSLPKHHGCDAPLPGPCAWSVHPGFMLYSA